MNIVMLGSEPCLSHSGLVYGELMVAILFNTQIKSLESENRYLKERYDKVEKQLAQVAAVASSMGASANGPGN